MFALLLEKNRVLEWDRSHDRWRPMHLDEVIADASLFPPLPVRALLDTARVDEAVLAALEARRPDLVARIEAVGEARGRAEGEARGHINGIRATCAALGIVITESRSRELERASPNELLELLVAITRDRKWPSRRS